VKITFFARRENMNTPYRILQTGKIDTKKSMDKSYLKFSILFIILFMAFGKMAIWQQYFSGVVENVFYWSILWTAGLFAYSEMSSSKMNQILDEKESHKSVPSGERLQEFRGFQRKYLFGKLASIFSDFIQGAYLYKAYHMYEFSINQIAILYLSGFLSSLFAGFFVGSIIDKYGRKRGVMLHLILNTLQSVVINFKDFRVLFLGRLISGVATSFLATAYECWMVSEHWTSGFPEEWLGDTFAAFTFGMGAAAALSGVFAGFLVDYLALGVVSPFNVCCLVSLGNMLYVTRFWKENYGNLTESASTNTKNALKTVCTTPSIFLLGLVHAFFEAVLYVFVFMWTPALRASTEEDLNLGLLFATFMISVMSGGTIFKIFSEHFDVSPQKILTGASFIGFLCMFVSATKRDTHSLVHTFVLYEGTVGVYYSAIGTLRGEHIPEWSRATIMNFSRVVLNALVVIMLMGPIGHKEWGDEYKTIVVFLLAAMGMGIVVITLIAFNVSLSWKSNVTVVAAAVDAQEEAVQLVDFKT